MARRFSMARLNNICNQDIAFIAGASRLKFYTGTLPLTGDTASNAADVLVATHTFGTPFAATSTANQIAPTLPANVNAVAAGTIGYYVHETSAGARLEVGSCTLAGGGGDMILSSLTATVGVPIQITAWSDSDPNV